MSSRFPYTDPYESNPYPALVPDKIRGLDPTLFDFLSELTRNLREQHNLIQVGDTTLPWQLLTKTSAQQQFNLGCRARFLHHTHGLISARYVQFNQWQAGLWSGAPVGYLRSRTTFLWEVTNKWNLVGVNNLAGLGAHYAEPSNGDFGWVIVDGVNIQSVTLRTAAPIQGSLLSWIRTEELGLAVPDYSKLGVIMNLTGMEPLVDGRWDLAPGSVRVDVENQ